MRNTLSFSLIRSITIALREYRLSTRSWRAPSAARVPCAHGAGRDPAMIPLARSVFWGPMAVSMMGAFWSQLF